MASLEVQTWLDVFYVFLLTNQGSLHLPALACLSISPLLGLHCSLKSLKDSTQKAYSHAGCQLAGDRRDAQHGPSLWTVSSAVSCMISTSMEDLLVWTSQAMCGYVHPLRDSRGLEAKPRD